MAIGGSRRAIVFDRHLIPHQNKFSPSAQKKVLNGAGAEVSSSEAASDVHVPGVGRLSGESERLRSFSGLSCCFGLRIDGPPHRPVTQLFLLKRRMAP